MVQTEISQLSRECNQWRETLRSYREELNQHKAELQQSAQKSLSREQLTDLEHFQNQLHIQLINIHDLKQSVKTHEKRVNFEVSVNGGQTTDETLTDHENLDDEYQALIHTLSNLQSEFKVFVGSL